MHQAGEVPPIGLAFWRWTAAAILILPLALPHLRRDADVMLRNWPVMLLLTALGISIFNTLLYLGAQTTTAINLVMLQTTMPVIVVLGSFLIFRETATPRQGAGIVASLLGALTLVSHGDPAILAHLDFKTGQKRVHVFDKGDVPSEAVFVPRSPDAPEGDGWLLATLYRGATNKSDLVILDAADIEAGPVATVHAPRRIPFGFHGNWGEL